MKILVQLIKHLFPFKILTHHIYDLINQLPDKVLKTNEILLSIEKDNKTRQYFSCTLQELMKLYSRCPPNERNLYEVILPTNKVKIYIDFEYYIDNNLDINNHYIGANCLLKILNYGVNFCDQKSSKSKNDIETALQRFIVLEA